MAQIRRVHPGRTTRGRATSQVITAGEALAFHYVALVERCGMRKMLAIFAWLLLTSTLGAGLATADDWNPAYFADRDVLELRTEREGESEHWFKVWLAVVDNQLYVRLGGRAADRINGNTADSLGLRVAASQYEVSGTPAPDMAEKVAAVIADKYPSDFLVRFFPHPLTLRLEPVAD